MAQLGQSLLLCFAFHLTANIFPYDAKKIFVISKILQCCIVKIIWLAQSQNLYNNIYILYMAQLRQSLLTASTYYTYCSSVTSILYPTVKMSIFAQWNIKTSQSDLQEEKRVHALKLNCKINSTNGGTFSKSAEKNIFIFFLFQGASVMSK